ncbi:thioredoxin family protein [Thiohalophilus sp.]|uniref:thioredoxin family protein n=1 Tax=Thiohalophilus sp. TaxID=3028392 RepID=UPI002ACEE414|nr:thioredoxin fold domain-containing protein [Thiohalophilus sp.]MDZ7804671.1 thioredoxin fold domain-containing protein [Thiohalophilus sp.]
MLLKKFWIIVPAALLLLAGKPALAADGEGLDEGMNNPGYHEKPAWFKNSFLDIREDIEEAAQQDKRLMLYFYQDGCPYCAKLLQDNFGQKNIADVTQENFDVIAINMWGDREVTDLNGNMLTEKKFAENLKVMFTPTLLMMNENGQVVLRINGYYAPNKFMAALEYVSQKKENQLSFREYYKQQGGEKASGKLHQADFLMGPPYNLEKLTSREQPLLLMFEQKQCKACDELHGDIYPREATREQLKRFDVVRLDMWSDQKVVGPDGKRTTAKKLAGELNIKYAPTLVFFDNSGNEVFRAEAYLRAFHVQSVMDYVASGAYKEQPNFQRYISARADKLEAQGVHVDLWD